jgi:hypothetical protein
MAPPPGELVVCNPFDAATHVLWEPLLAMAWPK